MSPVLRNDALLNLAFPAAQEAPQTFKRRSSLYSIWKKLVLPCPQW